METSKTEIIIPDKIPTPEVISVPEEIKAAPILKSEEIKPEAIIPPSLAVMTEVKKPLRMITPGLDHQKTQAIEKILATGLEPVFVSLEPRRQQIFKHQGEETVSLIAQLLEEKKINSFKIAELVKTWLRLVPDIEKAFIEKDAKIKLDRIMSLKI